MNSMNTEEYPQQRAALDFFERLHPKLMADFKSTIVNEANKDIKAEPTTVSEMYQRAEAHVSARESILRNPLLLLKPKESRRTRNKIKDRMIKVTKTVPTSKVTVPKTMSPVTMTRSYPTWSVITATRWDTTPITALSSPRLVSGIREIGGVVLRNF